jgi:type I restriction enzyme S subunit
MTVKQQWYKSWSLVSLEDLAVSEKGSIRRGPFGGSLKKEIFVDDGYLVYEQQHAIADDFSLGRYFINEAKYKEMEGFDVLPDDLIISCAGTIGKIAIAPNNSRPGIINQALMRIRPDQNKVLPIYLKRYLESPVAQREIFSKSSGSALKNLVAISEIKKSKIPLPPLEEQKRIAAILDKADRIRRKRQEAIRLTEELGRSIFLDMFGDPVTNPKGWEIVSMKSIVKQTQYGTSEKSNTERQGIPVLRMNNLTYKGDLDLHDIKWCEISEKDYEKYTVKKGDLLFNRTNSPELVGKTAVWNISDEYAFAGYLVRVRFNESKANSEYASAYLNSSHGKKYLSSKAKASINMSNFSASEFVKIPILLPSIDLQNQFKLIKEELESKKGKVEEFYFESENLFNSLLQRAFRGEL